MRQVMTFTVEIEWDGEAGVWYVAESNVPGLVAEASSQEAMTALLLLKTADMPALTQDVPRALHHLQAPLVIPSLVALASPKAQQEQVDSHSMDQGRSTARVGSDQEEAGSVVQGDSADMHLGPLHLLSDSALWAVLLHMVLQQVSGANIGGHVAGRACCEETAVLH